MWTNCHNTGPQENGFYYCTKSFGIFYFHLLTDFLGFIFTSLAKMAFAPFPWQEKNVAPLIGKPNWIFAMQRQGDKKGREIRHLQATEVIRAHKDKDSF